jgi:flavin reductase (DIM6/NTAB) family NADH-FMN oxidoreductase RutF
MPISPDTFKELMRRWASGITVLTCRHDGEVHGMTASAFCSVSLDPPLVLVCVGREHRTHAYIREQGVFGVHILDGSMQRLSDRCAGFLGEAGHSLGDLPHREEATGAPILEGVLGWLDCTLWEAHDAGDHTVFIGEIQAAGARDGQPLLWWNRGYHALGDPS